MIPRFKGIVEHGKLIIENRDRLGLWISSLDGEVEIIVRKPSEDRTDKQNRYYWAYLQLIADETGDTPNDLHEYFKRKHLPPRFITAMGKEVKVPNTTTKLTKQEFSNYITQIEMESGVVAPAPDDVDY